jgi:hypothetical protein
VFHQGVARRQHAFKVNPQLLRQLEVGEFVVISAGRYAKVAATRSGLSYGLPDLPAVRWVYGAVADARVMDELSADGTDDGMPHAATDPVLF